MLCHLPRVVSVTEGEDGCSALASVCVSLSVNWCLMMSHQVCRVGVSGGKKLIVMEHSRSHRLFKLIAYHSLVSHPGGIENIW